MLCVCVGMEPNELRQLYHNCLYHPDRLPARSTNLQQSASKDDWITSWAVNAFIGNLCWLSRRWQIIIFIWAVMKCCMPRQCRHISNSTAQYKNCMTYLEQNPPACSGVVRIDPLHFLAGCLKRRLNQALSVLSLSLGFFWYMCCAVN